MQEILARLLKPVYIHLAVAFSVLLVTIFTKAVVSSGGEYVIAAGVLVWAIAFWRTEALITD